MRRKLLRWFGTHRRDFFWRRGGLTAFQVLLVEFLLWKTNARAEPVIRRIVLAHPDPASVARRTITELEEDLRPLGLQRRRSKAMAAFAREILERHAGETPTDVATLQRLTGIGQYAARATSCLLEGSRLMPIDANTSRIVGRLLDVEPPSVRQPGADWDARLLPFVPTRLPERFLWATMDLAAAHCTARGPKCGTCPLRTECRTGRAIVGSGLGGGP